MHNLELKNINNVLLLGANGGIGQALLSKLLAENKELQVYALSRHPVDHSRVHNSVCDLINEESLSVFLAKYPNVKFNLILNTIGFLENELGGPEKSLRDINEAKLLEYFRINAILTPVLAKVVRNHLASEGFAFVALSAMVGSVGENELGGWYGYRASKTALNAFLKNISIEWGRVYKNSLVLAIHPGTTQTRLSEKFNIRVTHKIHTPDEAAKNICDVIFSTEFERSGSFLNWDGRSIGW
jgi:NAD(P)-dependent dehydrogenase (short-subunit alcohol dehydrogenase family)